MVAAGTWADEIFGQFGEDVEESWGDISEIIHDLERLLGSIVDFELPDIRKVMLGIIRQFSVSQRAWGYFVESARRHPNRNYRDNRSLNENTNFSAAARMSAALGNMLTRTEHLVMLASRQTNRLWMRRNAGPILNALSDIEDCASLLRSQLSLLTSSIMQLLANLPQPRQVTGYSISLSLPVFQFTVNMDA